MRHLSNSAWQKPGSYGASNRAPNRATMGAVMGTKQQRAITTPGQSTRKRKSTTTIVTTPTPPGHAHRVRAATRAESGGAGGSALEVPAVSREQMAKLKSIMARHHQLLLQQATLSVRVAYVQMVRKHGGVNVVGGGQFSPHGGRGGSATASYLQGQRGAQSSSSSLPRSQLDAKSLTFCARSVPDAQSCSYVNDFFGGESPEELSECLDGSVGMLHDLEQNWKDAERYSLQLQETRERRQRRQQRALAPNNGANAVGGRRNLDFGEEGSESAEDANVGGSGGHRPLTRSAFTRTLLERELEDSRSGNDESAGGASTEPSPRKVPRREGGGRRSVFEVRGLGRVKDAISAIDNSVKDIQSGLRGKAGDAAGTNILIPDSVSLICLLVLASIDCVLRGKSRVQSRLFVFLRTC